MKRIILIAPPASGKGMQAKNICTHNSFYHLSTGNLLRKEAEKQTDIKMKLNEGEFVNDEIVMKLVVAQLDSLTNINGYVLDGFPRNIEQANVFDDYLFKTHQKVDYVIYIDVDKEISKKRLIGRQYCSKCGYTYNKFLKDSMPVLQGICDYCHSQLVQREDDNETTFEKRYQIYMEMTKPLIDYYQKQGILYEVNGEQVPNQVSLDIQKIIEGEK